MEEIVQDAGQVVQQAPLQQTLQQISLGALVVGVVLLVVTIGVAIQFDIPKIYGQLSGLAARKGIRSLQARGFRGAVSAAELQETAQGGKTMASAAQTAMASHSPARRKGRSLHREQRQNRERAAAEETASGNLSAEQPGRERPSAYAGGETVPLDETADPSAMAEVKEAAERSEKKRPSAYAGGETVPLSEHLRKGADTPEMEPLEKPKAMGSIGRTVPLDMALEAQMAGTQAADFVIVTREMKTQSKVVIPVPLWDDD